MEINEAKIHSLILALGTLVDQREFTKLQTLMHNPITLDYTSTFGGDIEHLEPAVIIDRWALFLPGFENTFHNVSNIEIIELTESTAKAKANVVASHFLGGYVFEIKGNYLYEFKANTTHNHVQWKVSALTFSLTEEKGSRDLLSQALVIADKYPTPYIARKRTINAVKRFLTILETKDMEKLPALWTEDIVYDLPFSPPQFVKQMKGIREIMTIFRDWPKNSGKADFTSAFKAYPMKKPHIAFVEFKGNVDIIPTGLSYHQTYGTLVKTDISGNKITYMREYYDPNEFVRAFGLASNKINFDK